MPESKKPDRRYDPSDVPGPVSVVVGSAIAGVLLLIPAVIVGVGRASWALIRAGKRLVTKAHIVERP